MSISHTQPKSLRIFLVENHEDTRRYFTLYLQHMGHTVISATTMKEALETLPSSGCDVLISDIGLPDGSGWELMEQVRLERPVYAIAMSGYGMTADRARSKAAGFREHLLKPIDPDVFDEMLEKAARETAGAP